MFFMASVLTENATMHIGSEVPSGLFILLVFFIFERMINEIKGTWTFHQKTWALFGCLLKSAGKPLNLATPGIVRSLH